MRAFAEKPKVTGQSVVRVSSLAGRTLFRRSWQETTIARSQPAGTTRALHGSAETRPTGIRGNEQAAWSFAAGHDFSHVPVFSKDVQGGKKDSPTGGTKKDTPAPTTTKRAGVESFWVNWTENTASTATDPKLRLDFQAKFMNDDKHDPALAEFRQNASHTLEITAGPHKGGGDTRPLHDDNYSRADDKGGHDINDIYFLGNDNPGPHDLDKDDVIRFSFTAEQMVIDISDNDKVVKKLGPYTGGITGKHPRKTFGVPKMISFGKV